MRFRPIERIEEGRKVIKDVKSPIVEFDATRRRLCQVAALTTATLLAPGVAQAALDDSTELRRAVENGHPEALAMLQTWVRQPSIAAEDRGMEEGCDLAMRLLREAGFTSVSKIATTRHPAIFATLDAGARQTVAVYFMYDVKQADPAEWSSPPFDAALIDKPGLGKVLMGRGATNQKGPQAAFLAALHAIRAAGRKPPVNIVLVADGEEEIGSPSFGQVISRPEVMAGLRRSSAIFLPLASQTQSGDITVYLGAKGWVELELISSGAKWGRGPLTDVHSSEKARVDSPAWRLVEALSSLVADGGNTPAIDGLMEKVRPLSREDLALLDIAANRTSEADVQKLMGVRRWIDDMSWRQSLERLVSQPTVNIQGLVSGYTGPGGKTILPGRAAAKLDLRLVPDMTAADTVAKLKAHLARKGFGDIDVAVSGGYDPTTTSADSGLIRSAVEVYRHNGIDPVLMPRLPGSWPGYIFTSEPLRLPAGHFGLGHGNGAHAPDEYYLIESSNPRVEGMAGATMSYVQFLYELAARK